MSNDYSLGKWDYVKKKNNYPFSKNKECWESTIVKVMQGQKRSRKISQQQSSTIYGFVVV